MFFISFQEKYDESFVQTVYSAPLFTMRQVVGGSQPHQRVVRVQYSDKQGFKTQAKQLGIMDDLKVGGQGHFNNHVCYIRFLGEFTKGPFGGDHMLMWSILLKLFCGFQKCEGAIQF